MTYSSFFFLSSSYLLALLLSLLLMGVALPAVVPYVLPALYALFFFFFLSLRVSGFHQSEAHLFTWYSFWEQTPVQMSLLLDPATLEFSMVLLMLSFTIQVYAFNYFKKDPELPRFCLLLGLFIFFMLFMISTTSWTAMFVT